MPSSRDQRAQYRLWEEGKVPVLVYEGASPSTIFRDIHVPRPDRVFNLVRRPVSPLPQLS